ncbi:hypothetical protein ACWEKM_35790, partial [Streptomyces sp. NPDC004752]
KGVDIHHKTMIKDGYSTSPPTTGQSRRPYRPFPRILITEAAEHLRALSGTGWQCRPARLVSVRFVDGGARWYDEVGVLVHAEDGLLPAVEAADGAFGQHRYVVTHLSERRNYALQRHAGDAVPS